MQYGYGGAALAVASAVLICLTIWVLVRNPAATAEVACCQGHFLHGVASGEPHSSGIVLWTRLTPSNISRTDAVKVHWQVWEEGKGAAALAEAVVKGESSARPDRDFTVKVDVQSSHLKPQVPYAYQFSAGSERSPVGYFRLPPAAGSSLDSLRYAIFSCSNWRWGYFNAYGAAARERLDFWLHVGDYIYEHGSDMFPNDHKDVVRDENLVPEHETVSLEDYRQRHAMYRTDPDLQRLSSSAPLISIWDDHEVANNAWKGGADGHSSQTDGDYFARRDAALRAYHEWMPTRHQGDPWGDLGDKKDGDRAPWMQWRRLDFGDLASLLVLETRHLGRTEPPALSRGTITARITKLLESAPFPEQWPGSQLEKELRAVKAEIDADVNVKERTMLGKEQFAWIEKQVQNISHSGTRWQLFAQPVVVQEKNTPDYEKAIANARAAGGNAQAEAWRHVISKFTGLPDGKKKLAALVLLAAAKYKINFSFDDWMGYAADRARLTSILATGEPSATLVYGGDTHNAWAGSLRDAAGKIVATEFDGMSVSSPGIEYYEPRFPADLEAAAWRAANPDLVWADTHSRGFMLVSLSKSHQHIEYRGVDVKTPGNSKSQCLSAFDLARAGGGPQHAKCKDATDSAGLIDVSTPTSRSVSAPISLSISKRHGRVAGLRRSGSALSPHD